MTASSTPLSSAPRLSLAGRLRPARATQYHTSPLPLLPRVAASVLLPRVELAVPLALNRLEADSAPHRRHSEGPPLLHQHLERALCQPSVRSRCLDLLRRTPGVTGGLPPEQMGWQEGQRRKQPCRQHQTDCRRTRISSISHDRLLMRLCLLSAPASPTSIRRSQSYNSTPGQSLGPT